VIRLYRAYYHATPQVIQQEKRKRVQRDKVGRYVRRAFVDPDGRVMMVGWFLET
jgi:hypothetical protein